MDLLISTWSLAVTGTVVGLVGALTVFESFTNIFNTALDYSAKMKLRKRQQSRLKSVASMVAQKSEGGSGVSVEQFIKIVREADRAIEMTDADLVERFHTADSEGDGDGLLSKEEAENLMKMINAEEEKMAGARAGSDVSMSSADVSKGMDELKGAVSELREEMSRLSKQQTVMMEKILSM